MGTMHHQFQWLISDLLLKNCIICKRKKNWKYTELKEIVLRNKTFFDRNKNYFIQEVTDLSDPIVLIFCNS